MSTVSERLLDPEDNTHTLVLFLSLRASELAGALMFSIFLPWQRVFAWFALISLVSVVRWLHVNSAAFTQRSKSQRKSVYRIYTWLLMAYVGSASYFLYVPENLPIQAVLGIYVLTNATLVAVRLTGDMLRTAGGLCLAVLPTCLRFIVEGYQGNQLLMLMGIGGICTAASMVAMSRTQELNVLRHAELLNRAERAADAVAAVGLAKSRFFAAVSHDLRQPVHAIGLYLETLQRLSCASAVSASHVAVAGIEESWRALDDLLSQVLDLTHMDSGLVEAHLEAVDVASMVRSTVMQHAGAAENAGVRLVMLVKTQCYMLADEVMLKRVVSNLLDNAIKFSEPGANIVIALRPDGLDWRLEVRDSGVGVGLEAQERIFEEFVQMNNQSRDRQRGLGLGLAISRRFVSLMNGRITLRSALGKGFCIGIVLPRTTTPSDIPLRRRLADGDPSLLLASRPEFPEDKRQILLLEDDLLVVNAMRQLLESWGLQVHVAGTGEQALQLSVRAQIVICDVRLPHGVSGVDIALFMRRNGKKVLLLSGETDNTLRDTAKLHHLQLLTKPISPQLLFEALQNV